MAWTIVSGGRAVQLLARTVVSDLVAQPPSPGSSIGHRSQFWHLCHRPRAQLVHTCFAATHLHHLSLFVEHVPYLVQSQHGIGSVCSRRRRLRGRGFADEASSSSLGRTASLTDRACNPLFTAVVTSSSVELIKFVRDGIFNRFVNDGIKQRCLCRF